MGPLSTLNQSGELESLLCERLEIFSRLIEETDPKEQERLIDEYDSISGLINIQFPKCHVADFEYVRTLRKRAWNSEMTREEILHDHFPKTTDRDDINLRQPNPSWLDQKPIMRKRRQTFAMNPCESA